MPSPSSASLSLPTRFAIYDSDLSSDCSDSEIDVDEWVSVSSSTTVSTTSSLPHHLQLRVQPKAPKSWSCSSNGIGDKPVFLQHRNGGVGRFPPEISKPGVALKKLMPKLSTVYIVNPERLPHPVLASTMPNEAKSGHGGSEPVLSGQSPIELLHNGEYLRICARCAKPKMIISCDGRWKMDGGGICDLHTSFMRNGGDMSNEHKSKLELVGVLLEALQPFKREDLNKIELQIFDMTVPSDSTQYVHQKGCGH